MYFATDVLRPLICEPQLPQLLLGRNTGCKDMGSGGLGFAYCVLCAYHQKITGQNNRSPFTQPAALPSHLYLPTRLYQSVRPNNRTDSHFKGFLKFLAHLSNSKVEATAASPGPTLKYQAAFSLVLANSNHLEFVNLPYSLLSGASSSYCLLHRFPTENR